MLNFLVIFGGRSYEHEISIITGLMCANVIDRRKFNVVPMYISANDEMYAPTTLEIAKYRDLKEIKFDRCALFGKNFCIIKGKKIKKLCEIDVALNCCHGGSGEGGLVSAMLEINGIPSCSPSTAPSAIGLDKNLSKSFARSFSIPVLPSMTVIAEAWKKRKSFALNVIKKKVGYPLIIKPARLGSSIGIKIVRNEDETERKIDEAFCLDDELLIEKYLEKKREFNVGAYKIDGKIYLSQCKEVGIENEFFSFKNKYEENGMQGAIYKEIESEISDKMKSYTKLLYKKLSLSGIIRVDYLCSEGNVYFNEINTVPGSLSYYLFCENMGEFSSLLTSLAENAIKEYKVKEIMMTGILNNYTLNACKTRSKVI